MSAAKAARASFERVAIVASETPRAQEALAALEGENSWVPISEADAVVVLGGDGFMLQTLHSMLDAGRIIPAYGMNLGTVGFLMNRYDKRAAVM
ncbi:MAG: NAD(+) kinase, partial [Pseudomonadota bacterium]|nr:NAD(+) kinase [Pseudomonadota bacterium]